MARCTSKVGEGTSVGDGDECLPQCPTSSTLPGVDVKVRGRGESVSFLASEERPGQNEVAGRVTNATDPEVDNGGKSTVADEKIAGRHVAVEPHGVVGPACAHGVAPDAKARVSVHPIAKDRDSLVDLVRIHRRVASPERRVPSRLQTRIHGDRT